MSAEQPLHIVLHKSFDIPAEHHESLQNSDLNELVLEGDIQPDDYYLNLLDPSSETTVSIPRLSQSIIKLNLIHFTWGYPSGFLSTLGQRLPDLKCLRLYRQKVTGPNAETRRDAQQFLYRIPDLCDLYLYDVHGDPDFFIGLGQAFKRPGQQGLLILHVDYTEEIDVDDFVLKLPIPELGELIHASIVDLNFNMRPKAEKPRGIIPWPNSGTHDMLAALVGDATAPRALKYLTLTLFQLTVEQLRVVLLTHRGLFVLRVVIKLERPDTHLATLLDILALCSTLRGIEVVLITSVLNDSHNQIMNGPNRNPRLLLPTLEDVQTLSQSCPNLRHVYANFSRIPSFGTAHWVKEENGMWNGSIEIPADPFDFTANQHM